MRRATNQPRELRAAAARVPVRTVVVAAAASRAIRATIPTSVRRVVVMSNGRVVMIADRATIAGRAVDMAAVGIRAVAKVVFPRAPAAGCIHVLVAAPAKSASGR